VTYEEKQLAKLERYQELVVKNKNASESAYNGAKRISDVIPFGQPILCGHYSEKRHRRDIDRIHNGFSKSVELSKKSEYYEEKVKNILNPTSISLDNPDAVNLLKEKLVLLEAKREKFKEYNKNARKNHTDSLPSYELSNLSQNIASVKKRITYLESQSKIVDSEEEINGVRVKIDKEDNRIRLFFDGKPEQKIIDELKHNGFHWSPYNKAWQRQISNYAIRLAKEICSKIIKEVTENGTNTSTTSRDTEI